MLKQLKVFYNKENLYYSSGYVDPFKFHSTFYFILKAFRVVDNHNHFSMFNQNAVLFSFAFVALIIFVISLIHGVEISDISHITEAGTYCLALLYKFLIMSCTKFNVPQYNNLLEAMQNDFIYICNHGEKYRKKFFHNQLTTWKICLVICVLVVMVAIGMDLFAIVTLLHFLVTNTDVTKQRPLVFPIWLYDINLTTSPLYEVLFSFCFICVILYAYNSVFMMQTQVLWIRQITTKADIIIWNIEDLLVDIHPARDSEEKNHFWKILQNRLREIVLHHQSMYSLIDDYAAVYKKLYMFEQKFFGPIACLCAYCAVLKIEEGEVNGVLMVLCGGTVMIYFINSFLCTYLTEKVKAIRDACWNIPFWNADPKIRPYMVLIMQRSLRPLPLQAAGFEEISLQTFSKNMAAAYSSFNMLRQLNV